MKKVVNKLFVTLVVFTLVGMNFLGDVVYASNLINETSQNSVERESVEFNAGINGQPIATADFLKEQALNLKLAVNKGGYLKNIKIAIDGNNYVISKSVEEINGQLNSQDNAQNGYNKVKSINGNQIELNEIDVGNNLEVNIPIKFNKEHTVSEIDLNKESSVKLQAVYVDETGNETKIEKNQTIQLNWNTNVVENIEQKLTRFIKYENKTLVGIEIKDGIKDDLIPVRNKKITIITPKINNQNPAKVIVSGDNIQYNYNAGQLEVTKNNTPNNEGKYEWNSQDTYTVTYVYNTQSSEEKIQTQSIATVTTIKNQKIEGTTQINEFNTSEVVGNIVNLETEGTTELNKGYMYTSSKTEERKIDTSYVQNYKINIGYSEILDKVQVQERNTNFLNQDNDVVKDITSSVRISKVSVNAKDLNDVLGDSGSLIIKDESGNEIGILDKGISEREVNVNRLIIETSKPQKEGDINIKVEKLIIGNADSDKYAINNYKKINTQIDIKGYAQDQEISTNNVNNQISLIEPSSKASLSLSTDRLSTVVENKNIVFNVVLNKNDVSDMLYTNPIIKLRLPSEISNIEVTSAKVLYEDEITAGTIDVNDNEIILKLNGDQTQYNTSSTTLGTLIRLETNLKLNNLVPSNIKNIELEYSNEFSGEVNLTQASVNIVAPSGFVTTNSLSVGEQNVTSIENDETIMIKPRQDYKTMEISASLINNLGYDANGFTVVGHIPYAGNKTIGGAELNSNISTTLTSQVEVNGLEDAIIYYSDNVNETIDGNGWKTEASASAKSYKIVKNTPLADKSTLTFKYQVSIPEILQYGSQTRQNYGVYYNNDAQAGVDRNLVESKVVGISTGNTPQIKIETSAIDTNEGFQINNNGNVTEGEYVTYNAKIINTGSEDFHNVKVTARIPDELVLVNYVKKGEALGRFTDEFQEDDVTKTLTQQIDTLKGGEEQTLQFFAKVNQLVSDVTATANNGSIIGIDKQGNAINETTARTISVSYSVGADILETEVQTGFSVKNTKGNVNLKLSSDAQQTHLKQNQEIIYNIKLSNTNFEEKSNVKVSLNLPEGITYKETLTGNESNYDQNSNKVNINVGKLSDLETKEIKIKTENKSSKSGELITQAIATSDGATREFKSNEIKFVNERLSDAIEISQYSNITNELTDKDNLELYIDIKNKGTEDRTISFIDAIPNELSVNKYIVTVDGKQVYQGDSKYINNIINIPTGKTARIEILLGVYPLNKGDTVEITNQPIVTDANGETIKASSISLKLIGTNETTINSKIQEEQVTNVQQQSKTQQTVQEDKTFKIRGVIWYDENKDGKKDNKEQKISSVQLKLYNNSTKNFVKDANNNDVIATSNENGEYVFSELKKGEYSVITFYDNEKYEISSYKVDGLTESENSNFVSAKLNGQEVAVSDIIKIAQENIYNIDLGLVKREIFDLQITKNVSKVTVVSANNNVKEYEYNNEKARVELSDEDAQNSTILVEYNINVQNNSDVSGYAKSVVDYLPQGMIFSSELNPDWYLSKNGNLHCASITNEKLNPGESKDIKLILTKRIVGENTGLVRGRTEIKETYNENGLAEINALSSGYTGENSNIATSDVIILKQSRVKAIIVIAISIGIIALIGFAGFEVKKRVIDKLYNYDQETIE